MTERLTREDALHVAKLARLTLSDEELDRFTPQLDAILDQVAALQKLDLDNVTPMSHPLPLTNVLRPDVVRPSLQPGDFLSSAPASEDDMFRVPPVLGEPQ